MDLQGLLNSVDNIAGVVDRLEATVSAINTKMQMLEQVLIAEIGYDKYKGLIEEIYAKMNPASKSEVGIEDLTALEERMEERMEKALSGMEEGIVESIVESIKPMLEAVRAPVEAPTPEPEPETPKQGKRKRVPKQGADTDSTGIRTTPAVQGD